MTNGETYKTAKERAEAFIVWCKGHACNTYPCKKWACAFEWLDIEAPEEKLLPCPFCGGECDENETSVGGRHYVMCSNCDYTANTYETAAAAIAAHNRVARAVVTVKGMEGAKIDLGEAFLKVKDQEEVK